MCSYMPVYMHDADDTTTAGMKMNERRYSQMYKTFI